jgi:hypothetical protein
MDIASLLQSHLYFVCELGNITADVLNRVTTVILVLYLSSKLETYFANVT